MRGRKLIKTFVGRDPWGKPQFRWLHPSEGGPPSNFNEADEETLLREPPLVFSRGERQLASTHSSRTAEAMAEHEGGLAASIQRLTGRS